MSPERFKSEDFRVTADDLTVETTRGKFADAWVVFANLGGERYAVTQSPSVFVCCQWLARFRRLEAA